MNAVLLGVAVGASVIALGLSSFVAAWVFMQQVSDDLPDAGEADEPEVDPLARIRADLTAVERAIAFDREAARARVRAAIDRAAAERGWTDHDDAELRELLGGAS